MGCSPRTAEADGQAGRLVDRQKAGRQADRWSDRWVEEPVVCPGLGVSCLILLDRCQFSRSGAYVSSEQNSDLVALK